MAASDTAAAAKPAHLEPSELGTKEYWDNLYTTEIRNHAHDPRDKGTVWFDDSDAEAKLIEFLSDMVGAANNNNNNDNNIGDNVDTSTTANTDTTTTSTTTTSLSYETTSFLDLGTGNGSLLFGLRDAGWSGPMLGVDYSEQSVELARRIGQARSSPSSLGEGDEDDEEDDEDDDEEDDDYYSDDADESEQQEGQNQIRRSRGSRKQPRPPKSRNVVWFERYDILAGPSSPSSPDLIHGPPPPPPSSETIGGEGEGGRGRGAGGWDVVLDKGTFDAISLSSDMSPDNSGRRASEGYRDAVLPLVANAAGAGGGGEAGGLFLITSCNWTEEELIRWFTSTSSTSSTTTATTTAAAAGEEEGAESTRWRFEKVGVVSYPSFSFGGVKGQTISSVCFRKVRR